MIPTHRNKLIGVPISTPVMNLEGTMSLLFTVLVFIVFISSSLGFRVKVGFQNLDYQKMCQMQELTAFHLQLATLDKQMTSRDIFCAEVWTYIVAEERGGFLLTGAEVPPESATSG